MNLIPSQLTGEFLCVLRATQVSYTPLYAGETFTEHFVVEVVHGAPTEVSCSGSSCGPRAALSTDMLEFTSPCGGQASRTFTILNECGIELHYQIVECDSAVFKPTQCHGVIAAHSRQNVTIKFCPSLPIRYHNKLTVLVDYHCPLTLDLLGTSNDSKYEFLGRYPSDPRPVLAQHVMNLAGFQEKGWAIYPPADIQAKAEAELANGVGQRPPSSSVVAQPLVTLSTRNIDFGACPAGSRKLVDSIKPQTMSLSNTTLGDLDVSWISPGSSFSIEPTRFTLPKGETKLFMVNFRPVHANQFYHAHFDCYIEYTGNVDTMPDEYIMPPIHETLEVHAHSYPVAPPTKLVWSDSRLLCPPSHQAMPSYVSVVVSNEGESSALLNFSASPSSNTQIECLPGTCVVAPRSKQLVNVMVTSTALGTSDHTVVCEINGTAKHVLTVVSAVHTSTLALGNQAQLFFPPTCAGLRQTSSFEIHNPTGAPTWFNWELSEEMAKCLSVYPVAGELQPNDKITCNWSFESPEPGAFSWRVPCSYGSLGTTGSASSDNLSGDSVGLSHIVVIAECCPGELQVVQRSIDLGEVVFNGEPRQFSVSMYNPTSVDVQYLLETDDDNVVLTLDHIDSMLPSMCRREVQISAQPKREGQFTANVYYSVGSEENYRELFNVTLDSVSPCLEVTNACCTSLSKGEIWRRFDLVALNELLRGTVIEDLSQTAGLDSVTLDFGAAVEGSVPREVCIELTNTGGCPASWSLLFPEDLTYRPERWAEKDEPSEAELHQTQMVKDKIFEATPSTGSLAQGASTTIKLRYKHSRPAKDQLAVFFQIGSRPKVALNLQARTIAPCGSHLDDLTGTFPLEPVPIGTTLPPVQHITLRNSGDAAITVTVDATDFAASKADNFNFDVFKCEAAEYEVSPDCDLVIPVRFHPIEVKEYTATLTLHFADGTPDRSLSVVGQGFDPRARAVPPSIADAQLAVPARPYDGGVQHAATLTAERLHFGTVATNSRSQRMLFVCNTHPEGHWLSVKFDAGLYSDVVQFEPREAVLTTGESRAVRVHFKPSGVPRIVSMDACCAVTDLNVVAAHTEATDEAKAALEESLTYFTFTDAGRTGRGRAGGYGPVEPAMGHATTRGVVTDLASFPDQVLEAGFRPAFETAMDSTAREIPTSAKRVAVSDLELRTTKYHALPPIQMMTKRRAEDPAPLAPPMLLFCGISGTVVLSDEADASEQFIDGSGVEMGAGVGTLKSESKDEDSVVTELLSVMFDEIIHAEDMGTALADTSAPPIYFRQLRAPGPPAGSDSVTDGVGTEPAVAAANGSLASLAQPKAMATVEELLENTFANILAEASCGEFDVTARTRKRVGSGIV